MKIYIDLEIKEQFESGEISSEERMIREFMAKKQREKRDKLNELLQTRKLYTGAAIAKSDSIWKEQHLELLIIRTIEKQSILTQRELDKVFATLPEDEELNRNSFNFFNNAVAKILYPKTVEGYMVNVTFDWLENFVVDYAIHIQQELAENTLEVA